MKTQEKALRSLVLKLFEINAFKFGDFRMKIGINSPVYFDLRVIVSYPEIMNEVSKLLVEFIEEKNLSYNHVCGVPYTALPIATLISVSANKPMLIRRKEAKSYGTKRIIEGKFKAGEDCIIIEDVVTSGSSILETVKDLRNEGIKVSNAIVVVDREQGGVKNISEHSVKMHSLFTLSYLLNVLKDAQKIDHKIYVSVSKYINDSQIHIDGSYIENSPNIFNELPRMKMTFSARAELAKCPIARDLFYLMSIKKTNLCLAADLTTTEEILRLADECGPYICLLKTHVDIIEDFNESFINSLVSIAKKHNFLIMEDRKFADIGNTVSLQYSKGVYKICSWADIVTAHSIPGKSIIKGLKDGLKNEVKSRGVVLVAEMSSQANLITEKYIENTVKLTTETDDIDFITGIVCQNSETFSSPGILQLTPGVKIDNISDNLGQKYNTPEYIVKEKGADIAIVGRGLLHSKPFEKTAKLYRDRTWAAYCDRIGLKV